MTKRVRTFFFYALIGIFFAASPVLVLYSQGYRFDFENKKLVRTGGIFLKVLPKQADVYLDGKPIRKTDFFFGTALIDSLLPKKYGVKIKKEGYQVWEKKLEVKGKLVSEAKFITLFPEKLDFSVLLKDVGDFWFSPDKTRIALLEKNKNDWAVKLYDLKRKVKSHVISESEMSPAAADFLNLEWAANSREILLEIAAKEDVKTFSLDIGKTPAEPTGKKSLPVPKGTIAWQEFEGVVYYLDSSGFLYKGGPDFKEKTKLSQKPFSLLQETKYELETLEDRVFLKESDGLHLLNSASGAFEKIFDGIKDYKISPDRKRLAVFSDSDIQVLFLKDALEQPAKKTGEKIIAAKTSKNIDEIFWLNDNHLIFSDEDSIRAAEIDDRGGAQSWNLGNIAATKFFFNDSDNRIYILSQDNLYFSDNLF